MAHETSTFSLSSTKSYTTPLTLKFVNCAKGLACLLTARVFDTPLSPGRGAKQALVHGENDPFSNLTCNLIIRYDLCL